MFNYLPAAFEGGYTVLRCERTNRSGFEVFQRYSETVKIVIPHKCYVYTWLKLNKSFIILILVPSNPAGAPLL